MTRQEAIELLNNDAFKICMVQLRDPLVNACHEALCMAIEALKQDPSRAKGEWLPIIESNEFGEPYQSGIYCSECGETLNCEANYCPNCGAKMKNEDEVKK